MTYLWSHGFDEKGQSGLEPVDPTATPMFFHGTPTWDRDPWVENRWQGSWHDLNFFEKVEYLMYQQRHGEQISWSKYCMFNLHSVSLAYTPRSLPNRRTVPAPIPTNYPNKTELL